MGLIERAEYEQKQIEQIIQREARIKRAREQQAKWRRVWRRDQRLRRARQQQAEWRLNHEQTSLSDERVWDCECSDIFDALGFYSSNCISFSAYDVPIPRFVTSLTQQLDQRTFDVHE